MLEWVPKRDNCAMNYLEMSLQQSIVTLRSHGWSFRRIARELRIRRETVSKVGIEVGIGVASIHGGELGSLLFIIQFAPCSS